MIFDEQQTVTEDQADTPFSFCKARFLHISVSTAWHDPPSQSLLDPTGSSLPRAPLRAPRRLTSAVLGTGVSRVSVSSDALSQCSTFLLHFFQGHAQNFLYSCRPGSLGSAAFEEGGMEESLTASPFVKSGAPHRLRAGLGAGQALQSPVCGKLDFILFCYSGRAPRTGTAAGTSVFTTLWKSCLSWARGRSHSPVLCTVTAMWLTLTVGCERK